MAVVMRRLGATVPAGSSALAGILLLAVTMVPAMGQLMSHFGLSYEQGLLVVSLVAAGSIVFFWMFPYLIPVIGTIRLLLFYFGTGVVVGW